jgi:RsiW-degrading membrane proteinase PrsW (M82 family)
LQQILESPDIETLCDLLPDNRLEGAHLARRSWMHWLYALLSVVGFLTLLTLMFPNAGVSPQRLFVTGLVTGTIGILLLLAFQWVAGFTQGFNLRGRSIIVVLFYIVKFIGFSYRCALEEGSGFALSFMGFTFGVGLCEEICKALPIAIYLTSTRDATWKGACLVGLASGIGFGVSEGLMYSSDYYNGIAGFSIYLVRFVSCVALHALWSGCVAQLMYRNQDHLSLDGDSVLGFLLYYLAIAMVLHGLYDTLLKQEYHLWALGIAVGSFGWFVVMVSRQDDD